MEQEIKDIMQRLLMNLLQMEYDVLPTKVFKEDKAEYILLYWPGNIRFWKLVKPRA